MKYNKKAICQTANTLRKRGYTLSQAFVLAWAIAKGATVKVAGTSKLNRQEALRRLTKYEPSETRFTLIREAGFIFVRDPFIFYCGKIQIVTVNYMALRLHQFFIRRSYSDGVSFRRLSRRLYCSYLVYLVNGTPFFMNELCILC